MKRPTAAGGPAATSAGSGAKGAGAFGAAIEPSVVVGIVGEWVGGVGPGGGQGLFSV